MSACETRMPVSKATRRQIRVLKAREGFETYDETVGALIDAYEPEDTN